MAKVVKLMGAAATAAMMKSMAEKADCEEVDDDADVEIEARLPLGCCCLVLSIPVPGGVAAARRAFEPMTGSLGTTVYPPRKTKRS